MDLTTHVRDVVNHVLYEDLRDIVLLGFSYGGMVVSGALEHVGDRVRELVFLDAFVPDDGDSLLTLNGAPARRAAEVGEEWLVTAPPRRFDDPDEEAFAAPRRTPQPVATFTEAVHLAQPLEAFPFGRTYIRATVEEPGLPTAAFDRAAERARSSPDWRYRETRDDAHGRQQPAAGAGGDPAGARHVDLSAIARSRPRPSRVPCPGCRGRPRARRAARPARGGSAPGGRRTRASGRSPKPPADGR